jgi:ligand-binding sensor domain-containing protein
VLDIFAIAETPAGITVATSSGVFDVHGGRLARRAGSPSAAQSLLPRGDGLWVGSLAACTAWTTRDAVPALPAEVASAAVTRLAEAQGRVWAGTSLGLYLREGNGWRAATDVEGLRNAPITMLLEDRAHSLWGGSNAGMARFRDGALSEFIPESSPSAVKGVIGAFEDREGSLWLGSHGKDSRACGMAGRGATASPKACRNASCGRSRARPTAGSGSAPTMA